MEFHKQRRNFRFQTETISLKCDELPKMADVSHVGCAGQALLEYRAGGGDKGGAVHLLLPPHHPPPKAATRSLVRKDKETTIVDACRDQEGENVVKPMTRTGVWPSGRSGGAASRARRSRARLEVFLARKECDREVEQQNLLQELEFQQFERERQEVEFEEGNLFPAWPCYSGSGSRPGKRKQPLRRASERLRERREVQAMP